MRNAILILSAVVLALAASVIPVSPVAAQQAVAPSPEAMAGARAAYARGEAEFQAGNFAAAEAAFLQAYDFVANPIVLIGAAQSRERQGDLPGAVEFYQRYLTERPDASDRQQWEERIQEHMAQPGTLVVRSDPAGAAVSVDGEALEQPTPTEVSLPAGEHMVTLRLDEYLDARQTVNVPYGGRVEHDVSLAGLNDTGGGDAGTGAGGGVNGLGGGTGSGEDDGGIGTEIWIASGVAGVALVTGTVLGFLALSEQSEFDENPTNEAADSGEQLALLADISFGVALAAAVTGLVLHLGGGAEEEAVAERDPGEARVEFSPIVAPTGGGVSARLQF